MKNSYIIKQILKLESLNIIKRFSSGNSGALVFKVTNNENNYLVLKIALNKRARFELDKNEKGFQALSESNLEDLIPDFIKIKENFGVKYALTNYLGKNFLEQTYLVSNPSNLFEILSVRMSNIYKRTLIHNNSPRIFFKNVRMYLEKTYLDFLIPEGLLPKTAEIFYLLIWSQLYQITLVLEFLISHQRIFIFKERPLKCQTHLLK